MYTSILSMEEVFHTVCSNNQVSRSTFLAGLIKASLSEHIPTLAHGIFDNGRDNVMVSVDAAAYFVNLMEHLRQNGSSTIRTAQRE